MPGQQISPELIQLIKQKMAGGGGAGGMPGGMPGGPGGMPPVSPPGAPPGAPPGSPQSAPVTSPMANPASKDGDKAGATVQVRMAIKLLEKTVTGFGSESTEGATVLKVLGELSKTFGISKDKSSELIPAELMSLIGSIMPKGPMGAATGQPPAGGGMPQQPHPPM